MLQYIVTHMKDLDSFVLTAVIQNLIFAQRHKMISVISLSGEVIRRDLPGKLGLPEDMDSYASRLGFLFYQNGIIVPANLKSRIKEDNVPNPPVPLPSRK